MQSFNMINVAHTLLLDKVKQEKIMLDELVATVLTHCF